MPTDSNGNYALPAGYLAQPGDTILPSQHNPPLEDIATGLTARLMRSGAGGMTGPLKAADGLVGAPSYTFGSALSTGLYKTANGIGISVAGTLVAEFTAAGITKGNRYVGEIFDYTGSTAPSLCVLPYGQTLSRTTYADLWALAQVEIAAGNTFYNNGNGSTTFGIGDLRGRARAGKDDMGGSAASRLGATYFGADAKKIGNTGGLETHTLTLGQLATGITSTGTLTLSQGNLVQSSQDTSGFSATSGPNFSGFAFPSTATVARVSPTASGTVTSSNTGGNAHNNVQPTMILNVALFAGV